MWLWDIGGVAFGDSGEMQPSLLDELDITICRADKVGGASVGFVTRSADRALMFNEKASDAKASLGRTVRLWTHRFAEENPHLIWDTPTVELAAQWMASFPDLLAGHHQAVAMHEDVGFWVREARKRIDRPPLRLYVGICGGFDVREGKRCVVELFVAAGQRELQCGACETLHAVADRQRSLLFKLRSKVAPAGEVAEALVFFGKHLNVKTLRTWINRGRLTNQSKAGEEPTVLVGEVLDLMQHGGSFGVASCAEAA